MREVLARQQRNYQDAKYIINYCKESVERAEHAKEILANLGQNIDVVAGIFDDKMLKLRKCNGIEISKEKFCVAVSMHHRLANRKSLELH